MRKSGVKKENLKEVKEWKNREFNKEKCKTNYGSAEDNNKKCNIKIYIF